MLQRDRATGADGVSSGEGLSVAGIIRQNTGALCKDQGCGATPPMLRSALDQKSPTNRTHIWVARASSPGAAKTASVAG
jgi:hypothetical protein